MKKWMIGLLLLSALVFAGCTRSASQAPTDVSAPNDTGSELPFPVPTSDLNANPATGGDTADGMSTAIAGGFATQTAEAMMNTGDPTMLATATPMPVTDGTDDTIVFPTATPLVVEPTATSVLAALPTATPASLPVTNTPCTSPYTVSDGEWIWSIGRKCNIHPDDIIEANDLAWPYTLFPGNVLTLPANARPFPTGQ